MDASGRRSRTGSVAAHVGATPRDVAWSPSGGLASPPPPRAREKSSEAAGALRQPPPPPSGARIARGLPAPTPRTPVMTGAQAQLGVDASERSASPGTTASSAASIGGPSSSKSSARRGSGRARARRRASPPPPCTAVGAYKVGRLLGEGGFGQVRLGVHGSNGSQVALKFLPKGASMSAADAERIITEVSCLSDLAHPHVIRLMEVVNDREFVVIVLEYAPGGDLHDMLRHQPGGRFTEGEARERFVQIAKAVQYAHNRGVVHRDLKLENVLLGSKGQCLITDFGLSQYARPGEAIVSTGGSLFYMPPEVVRGVPSEGVAVDVWCLGVLLYALLTGVLPFRSALLDAAADQLRDEHLLAARTAAARQRVLERLRSPTSATMPLADATGASPMHLPALSAQPSSEPSSHAAAASPASGGIRSIQPRARVRLHSVLAGVPGAPSPGEQPGPAGTLPPRRVPSMNSLTRAGAHGTPDDSAPARTPMLSPLGRPAALPSLQTAQAGAPSPVVHTAAADVAAASAGDGYDWESPTRVRLPLVGVQDALASPNRSRLPSAASIDDAMASPTRSRHPSVITSDEEMTSPDAASVLSARGSVTSVNKAALLRRLPSGFTPQATPTTTAAPATVQDTDEAPDSAELEEMIAAALPFISGADVQLSPRDYSREAEARVDVQQVIREVRTSVLRGVFEPPQGVSEPALDLLRSMLHPDPACRPNASQILRHPWVKATGSGSMSLFMEELGLRPSRSVSNMQDPSLHGSPARAAEPATSAHTSAFSSAVPRKSSIVGVDDDSAHSSRSNSSSQPNSARRRSVEPASAAPATKHSARLRPDTAHSGGRPARSRAETAVVPPSHDVGADDPHDRRPGALRARAVSALEPNDVDSESEAAPSMSRTRSWSTAVPNASAVPARVRADWNSREEGGTPRGDDSPNPATARNILFAGASQGGSNDTAFRRQRIDSETAPASGDAAFVYARSSITRRDPVAAARASPLLKASSSSSAIVAPGPLALRLPSNASASLTPPQNPSPVPRGSVMQSLSVGAAATSARSHEASLLNSGHMRSPTSLVTATGVVPLLRSHSAGNIMLGDGVATPRGDSDSPAPLTLSTTQQPVGAANDVVMPARAAIRSMPVLRARSHVTSALVPQAQAWAPNVSSSPTGSDNDPTAAQLQSHALTSDGQLQLSPSPSDDAPFPSPHESLTRSARGAGECLPALFVPARAAVMSDEMDALSVHMAANGGEPLQSVSSPSTTESRSPGLPASPTARGGTDAQYIDGTGRREVSPTAHLTHLSQARGAGNVAALAPVTPTSAAITNGGFGGLYVAQPLSPNSGQTLMRPSPLSPSASGSSASVSTSRRPGLAHAGAASLVRQGSNSALKPLALGPTSGLDTGLVPMSPTEASPVSTVPQAQPPTALAKGSSVNSGKPTSPSSSFISLPSDRGQSVSTLSSGAVSVASATVEKDDALGAILLSRPLLGIPSTSTAPPPATSPVRNSARGAAPVGFGGKGEDSGVKRTPTVVSPTALPRIAGATSTPALKK